ncbi:hypothetical protein AV545_03690 [Paenibacillus jamilae]|uniref:hypothetical protein n=1 Tax=Paenibacillus jamilae TaxID=114136 RepID=UPI0007AB8E71|nr:hypothetical protein [Paenibacillus jamilae]KZE65034.1 hypothetical protein AV545_03690 [Paenibacillus jamilae]
MGMYTGLRCKVYIKEEYREELQRLHEEGYEWGTSDFDFMRRFGRFGRASFIPCGSLSYMPDEWEDIPKKDDGSLDYWNGKATDGFERGFSFETGYWTFQCSLKNYESEIEAFFEEVLPRIADSIEHLEYYYEEWSNSIFYELKDGKIVQGDREVIKYGYDYTDEKW